MATINNSSLTKEIIDGAKIAIAYDVVPSQIADKVVPTMEVNPKLLRVCNIIKTDSAVNAASATIYTTPSDKDFFLTGAFLSVIKDATSTSSGTYLRVYDTNGVAIYPLYISSLTLTAQSESISENFSVPIKLGRNYTVAVLNTTNVANINATAGITGYTVDNANV